MYLDVLDSIKEELICPITRIELVDPYTTRDGFTYQRRAILQWLQNNSRSPLGGTQLPSKQIIPNIALKKIIQKFSKLQQLSTRQFKALRQQLKIAQLDIEYLREQNQSLKQMNLLLETQKENAQNHYDSALCSNNSLNSSQTAQNIKPKPFTPLQKLKKLKQKHQSQSYQSIQPYKIYINQLLQKLKQTQQKHHLLIKQQQQQSTKIQNLIFNKQVKLQNLRRIIFKEKRQNRTLNHEIRQLNNTIVSLKFLNFKCQQKQEKLNEGYILLNKQKQQFQACIKEIKSRYLSYQHDVINKYEKFQQQNKLSKNITNINGPPIDSQILYYKKQLQFYKAFNEINNTSIKQSLFEVQNYQNLLFYLSYSIINSLTTCKHEQIDEPSLRIFQKVQRRIEQAMERFKDDKQLKKIRQMYETYRILSLNNVKKNSNYLDVKNIKLKIFFQPGKYNDSQVFNQKKKEELTQQQKLRMKQQTQMIDQSNNSYHGQQKQKNNSPNFKYKSLSAIFHGFRYSYDQFLQLFQKGLQSQTTKLNIVSIYFNPKSKYWKQCNWDYFIQKAQNIDQLKQISFQNANIKHVTKQDLNKLKNIVRVNFMNNPLTQKSKRELQQYKSQNPDKVVIFAQ